MKACCPALGNCVLQCCSENTGTERELVVPVREPKLYKDSPRFSSISAAGDECQPRDWRKDFLHRSSDRHEDDCPAARRIGGNVKDNPTSVQFGEHLTRKQAALFLNVTESALIRWQRERRGPKVIKYGRIVRYRLKDLQDFLDS